MGPILLIMSAMNVVAIDMGSNDACQAAAKAISMATGPSYGLASGRLMEDALPLRIMCTTGTLAPHS